MKKFYFVGGPKAGQSEEFFRRLEQIGGTPNGWRIYPHARGDGMALHVVNTASEGEILDHLRHLEEVYEWSEIAEIIEGKK